VIEHVDIPESERRYTSTISRRTSITWRWHWENSRRADVLLRVEATDVRMRLIQ
jgi:hypothetical protein